MVNIAIVPYISKNGKWMMSGSPIQVPKTYLTENQIRLLGDVHNDILNAQKANLSREIIHGLECRNNGLIKELNIAYGEFKKDQQQGLQYIEEHLLYLTRRANQFSVDVYKTMVDKTDDNEKKTLAIAECAQQLPSFFLFFLYFPVLVYPLYPFFFSSLRFLLFLCSFICFPPPSFS